MSLKNVRKNINVLNLILVAAIAAIYFNVIAPMADGESSVKTPAARQAPLSSPLKIEDPQIPPVDDFMVIGDRNLFHPERMTPSESGTVAAEQKPDLILHGTFVSDDFRVAYVEEKRTARPMGHPAMQSRQSGRDRRERPIKQGEYIGGYVVKTIDAESITLLKGEDRIVVSIKEGKSYGRARAQETASTSGGPAMPPGRYYPAGSHRNPIPTPPNFDPSHSEPLNIELKRPVR